MRKLGLRIVLLPLLLLALPAAAQGLFWQVDKGQDTSRPSYLLGTIHSEDPRVTRLSPAVSKALEASTTFIMEVDLDGSAAMAMLQAMRLPPGQRLEALIGTPRYEKVLPLMTPRGMPDAVLQTMQPWVVFTTLSTPPQETGLFMDAVLQARAARLGKPVVGLETVQEQLAVFTELTLAEQKALIDEALAEAGNLEQELEKLLQAYVAGDLDRIHRIGQEDLHMSDPALEDKLVHGLLQARNTRMLERAQPYLQRGGAFIAVGALHLPGDDGLIALLRQAGYRLTPIQPPVRQP